MGKYLKQFTNHSDYEAFVGDGDFLKPNVSFCIEDIEVHFNPDIITYDTVDLGLPSGILWANKNIGANKETDKGVYFQWASTIPIDEERKDRINEIMHSEQQPSQADFEYVIETSPYLNTSGVTKYTSGDGLTTLEEIDDAAYVHMGEDWHIPSSYEIEELSACTTSSVETINGVEGVRLTSVYNSNSIFIPFTVEEDKANGTILSVQERKYDEDESTNLAFDMYFYNNNLNMLLSTNYPRFYPSSVRGVYIPTLQSLSSLVQRYSPIEEDKTTNVNDLTLPEYNYVEKWYNQHKKANEPNLSPSSRFGIGKHDGTLGFNVGDIPYYWNFVLNSNYEIVSYTYEKVSIQ